MDTETFQPQFHLSLRVLDVEETCLLENWPMTSRVGCCGIEGVARLRPDSPGSSSLYDVLISAYATSKRINQSFIDKFGTELLYFGLLYSSLPLLSKSVWRPDPVVGFPHPAELLVQGSQGQRYYRLRDYLSLHKCKAALSMGLAGLFARGTPKGCDPAYLNAGSANFVSQERPANLPRDYVA